jgi:hypothetical protein
VVLEETKFEDPQSLSASPILPPQDGDDTTPTEVSNLKENLTMKAKNLSLIHGGQPITFNPEELDDEAGIVSFRGRGHKSAMFERTVRFEQREDSPRKTQGPNPVAHSAMKASNSYMTQGQAPSA